MLKIIYQGLLMISHGMYQHFCLLSIYYMSIYYMSISACWA